MIFLFVMFLDPFPFICGSCCGYPRCCVTTVAVVGMEINFHGYQANIDSGSHLTKHHSSRHNLKLENYLADNTFHIHLDHEPLGGMLMHVH